VAGIKRRTVFRERWIVMRIPVVLCFAVLIAGCSGSTGEDSDTKPLNSAVIVHVRETFPTLDYHNMELSRVGMPNIDAVPRIREINEKFRTVYNQVSKYYTLENKDNHVYPFFSDKLARWIIRGFENALMDAVAEPDFYGELLDRLTDQYLAFVEYLLDLPVDAVLFGESPSRIVLSVSKKNAATLEGIAKKHSIPCKVLGSVGGKKLTIKWGGKQVIDASVAALSDAWRNAIPSRLK